MATEVEGSGQAMADFDLAGRQLGRDRFSAIGDLDLEQSHLRQ